MMSNSLQHLRDAGTTIASDTGAFHEIAIFDPTDATTNPSLVHAAVIQPHYADLVDLAVQYAVERRDTIEERTELAMDRLLVEVGYRILQIIPGQVSVSVDPRLGYNQEAMVQKGVTLARLLHELGIPPTRFLIKVPATWEGIQAARQLTDTYHLRTNMTLVFSATQARASAEAGAAVVSPFVGRVLDWHKKQTGRTDWPISDHPGVKMVKDVKRLYVENGYQTQIMAAGFRSIDEISALSGLDLMTLPPALLSVLQRSTQAMPNTMPMALPRSITAQRMPAPRFIDDEAVYRSVLAAEMLPVEKVAEGLERFASDTAALEEVIRQRVLAHMA